MMDQLVAGGNKEIGILIDHNQGNQSYAYGYFGSGT